ncbi:hypothetical protein BDQ12DRAFT_678720 [Crucibulum laeve]|uniref:Uncharacterized protein n=1 Tax=Crucibulum laeve TaxID=68775 RepID=A0A5C3MB35_9AGAR|nr:hypothetical protein BDQ12DRAFT_678720 [Crucibulum laeve]
MATAEVILSSQEASPTEQLSAGLVVHSPGNLDLHDSTSSSEVAEKISLSPRPLIIYNRYQLLALHNSPLVRPPSNMPELKIWFGEPEQIPSKKDAESPTPNSARERRFRRDVEDNDVPSRPTFRTTMSQPSQMGNFKHQSLRATDRERERERDTDKDRERDIRDKEGQERLRHLSDKYDRDRLALPTALRNKERDAAPHLGPGSSGKTAAHGQASGAASRRNEARDIPKKKIGETSEDWRRGAEPSRPGRDDQPARRDRDERERARSRARDSSKARRDLSSTRRDRDEGKDKGIATRTDRDRDDYRREREDYRRDRETDRDGDSDDPRKWRDDGKRDERIAARRTAERHGDRDFREKERARERPPQDWDGQTDRRWVGVDDRDGRYKRNATRDRKASTLEDGKDREREKEKEPAWMDTYIPNGSSVGILGGKGVTEELDGIQAWKKGLKEKERKEKEQPSQKSSVSSTFEAASNPTASETSNNQLDEIQLFKLLMRREEEKKKNDDTNDHKSSAVSSQTPDNTDHIPLSSAPHNVSGTSAVNSVSSPVGSLGYLETKTAHKDVSSGTGNVITVQNGKESSNTLSRLPNLSPSSIDLSQERLRHPASSKQHPNTTPDSGASIGASMGEVVSPQFNPPPGSRLLAFGRPAVRSPVSNNYPQFVNGAIPNSPDILPSQTPSGVDTSRQLPGFSPFDETRRQTHTDGQATNAIDGHRRLSNAPPLNTSIITGGLDSPDVGAAYAMGKGSRFAKFFDGKARDVASPPTKAQANTGFISSSPNLPNRQESSFNNGTNEPRTMDDIFAMLNSSALIPRGNMNQLGIQLSNPPLTSQFYNNAQALHQQNPHQHQQQLHLNNRLEPLYESRLDDRNFVPDGMVPGLRPAPPARARDNAGTYSEGDESLHFMQQRLQQQRIDPIYSGPSPVYGQQGLRNVSVLQQQPQFRGGPSPAGHAQNLINPQQQRLPPGLANLGGRPPHEPTQFMGTHPTTASAGLHPTNISMHQHQHQQNFNNFNIPYGGPHRAPLPPLHQMQNSAAQHGMGGLNHAANIDMRLSNQNHITGAGIGSSRGLNGGFAPIGPNGHQPPIPMRQQQQPPHIPPPHMIPHLLPPHLQQQGHNGPSNQPTHDLMALLLGGTHRD